jgi:hypothetical protein
MLRASNVRPDVGIAIAMRAFGLLFSMISSSSLLDFGKSRMLIVVFYSRHVVAATACLSNLSCLTTQSLTNPSENKRTDPRRLFKIDLDRLRLRRVGSGIQ